MAVHKDQNLSFEFTRQDKILFLFDQAKPEEVKDYNENVFRNLMLNLALNGVEGAGAMAEQFYGAVTDEQGRDCSALVASLIVFQTASQMNLVPLDCYARGHVIQRLTA